MGLHPNGIGAVLNLVMELRLRGYRICLSTHSPHVLDIIWALRFFQEHGGQARDVLKLLGLASKKKTRNLASAALTSELRTYYFARDGKVRDISDLDPGSDDVAEGGWGASLNSPAGSGMSLPTSPTERRATAHDLRGGREDRAAPGERRVSFR